MKSWNQWSRQNSLLMVMDNKGPQETKMETFPWWLSFTNPSETYASSQIWIPFPPKIGSRLWQTKIFLWLQAIGPPNSWRLAVPDLPSSKLTARTRKHGMNSPKRKVLVVYHQNLQVRKPLVSGTDPPMLWLRLPILAPNFWVSQPCFRIKSEWPQLTRNTTCFIVKCARFIPKVCCFPQNVEESNSTSIVEY